MLILYLCRLIDYGKYLETIHDVRVLLGQLVKFDMVMFLCEIDNEVYTVLSCPTFTSSL